MSVANTEEKKQGNALLTRIRGATGIDDVRLLPTPPETLFFLSLLLPTRRGESTFFPLDGGGDTSRNRVGLPGREEIKLERAEVGRTGDDERERFVREDCLFNGAGLVGLEEMRFERLVCREGGAGLVGLELRFPRERVGDV